MSNGSGWIKQSLNVNCSPLGEKAANLLGELFNGIYHIDRNALSKCDWSNNNQIEVTVRDVGFSTYDDGGLTRLVILAHKYNVRVTLRAAAFQYMKLVFVNVDRTGFFRDSHPSLDELIGKVQRASVT